MQDPREPIFVTNACDHMRPIVNCINATSAARCSYSCARLPSASIQYSTEAPPADKFNTGLYVGLGAVVLGGGVAYYLYDSSSETAKVASGDRPNLPLPCPRATPCSLSPP
ncbi:hypothetical protein BDR05DRAFT_963958 [Suillus weaverae]|nr:hypothetical protein BDR05DRAFT_963958 [Suillus weaverae]